MSVSDGHNGLDAYLPLPIRHCIIPLLLLHHKETWLQSSAEDSHTPQNHQKTLECHFLVVHLHHVRVEMRALFNQIKSCTEIDT